ncbi:guanine deaminase [Couchioplanes caeruleus]|uniref:Guanine deaminase n=1 Tax=Couchioplanes caeruleus TaxID=56438 RepID=A0A3N1GFE2_9ACTN|nr:guanine deaminase [Couchioplanes caeruleus]ROP28851.1 guanine deaminase [Couchioplanes caeruleus]
MTLYRAQTIDTPHDPFRGGALRADADAGLLVEDGVIVDRDGFARLRSRHPEAEVVELPGGVLLPGLVDTHVHFPQVRVIGALGMPLLEWLERCALPEESRLAEVDYARAVAAEFVGALIGAGTTTALVFGSHFATAVDTLFEAAAASRLRITSGLVVSDRMLREDLHTTAQRGYDEGRALAQRWHGTGHSRYAVTPRFSLSCSDDLLASCGQLHRELPESWFTSHINENLDEVATVGRLFEDGTYLDSYDRHGLVGPRSVLAHNVHPTDAELKRLAEAQTSVAHCPTSNAVLGSGIFPLQRHLVHGVPVALGCDVGAGTGFSLFKEGLQAYMLQRLSGPDGVALTAAHLLHLATAAGAEALGLRDQIGDLSVGKRFDAIWVRPTPGTPLDIGMRHASGPSDALAKVFALGTPHDVARVWIDGAPVEAATAERG